MIVLNAQDDHANDVQQLQYFVNSVLRKESPLVQAIRDMLQSIESQTHRPDHMHLTVEGKGLQPAQIVILSNATLEMLRKTIETALRKTNRPVTEILIKRSGLILERFDDQLASDCGLRDSDTLVVSFKPRVMRGVHRVYASGLKAQSRFQIIVLALHAFMLDEEFETVVELYDVIGSFMPTCKVLPKTTFLRPNWNINPCTVRIHYKCSTDYVLLSCEEVGEQMLVSLSFRNRKGAGRWIELNIAQFATATVTPSGVARFGIREGKELRSKLLFLVREVMPSFRAREAFCPVSVQTLATIRAQVAALKVASQGPSEPPHPTAASSPVHSQSSIAHDSCASTHGSRGSTKHSIPSDPSDVGVTKCAAGTTSAPAARLAQQSLLQDKYLPNFNNFENRVLQDEIDALSVTPTIEYWYNINDPLDEHFLDFEDI